jgi:exosortase/archaeosortase
MGLTWRDLVSSVAVGMLIIVFGAFEAGSSLLFLSTAWAASGTALALATCCAIAAAVDLHTKPQPRAGVIIRKATTVIGTIALLAGLAGVVGNSVRALEALVVFTTVLWATATSWHVYCIGAEW